MIDDDEFLSVATDAVTRDPGAASLDALGWWDMLPQRDDPDARRALFAVFRAQGRALASSGAFAGLLAHPFVPEAAPGTVAAVVMRRSARRGTVGVLVGDLPSAHLLVDLAGSGAALLPVGAAVLRPIEVPGQVVLHEVDIDRDALVPAVAEGDAAATRVVSVQLGRVALSLEMLGAAETALALAVEYAGAREQFGTPIGTFQAVRHLLAWARTDCAAIEAVAAEAVRLAGHAPAGFDEICKALAGRNARRACERTLQCFGGIGFTTEHPHHHFHSRVLAFDSLLGSSTDLMRDLGTRLRRSGEDPRIAEGLLLGARAERGE